MVSAKLPKRVSPVSLSRVVGRPARRRGLAALALSALALAGLFIFFSASQQPASAQTANPDHVLWSGTMVAASGSCEGFSFVGFRQSPGCTPNSFGMLGVNNDGSGARTFSAGGVERTIIGLTGSRFFLTPTTGAADLRLSLRIDGTVVALTWGGESYSHTFNFVNGQSYQVEVLKRDSVLWQGNLTIASAGARSGYQQLSTSSYGTLVGTGQYTATTASGRPIFRTLSGAPASIWQLRWLTGNTSGEIAIATATGAGVVSFDGGTYTLEFGSGANLRTFEFSGGANPALAGSSAFPSSGTIPITLRGTPSEGGERVLWKGDLTATQMNCSGTLVEGFTVNFCGTTNTLGTLTDNSPTERSFVYDGATYTIDGLFTQSDGGNRLGFSGSQLATEPPFTLRFTEKAGAMSVRVFEPTFASGGYNFGAGFRLTANADYTVEIVLPPPPPPLPEGVLWQGTMVAGTGTCSSEPMVGFALLTVQCGANAIGALGVNSDGSGSRSFDLGGTQRTIDRLGSGVFQFTPRVGTANPNVGLRIDGAEIALTWLEGNYSGNLNFTSGTSYQVEVLAPPPPPDPVGDIAEGETLIWTGTLGAGAVGGNVGYSALAGLSFGSLSPNTFTLEGGNYTVRQLNSGNASLTFGVQEQGTSNNTLPSRRYRLYIGNTAYDLTAPTTSVPAYTHQHNNGSPLLTNRQSYTVRLVSVPLPDLPAKLWESTMTVGSGTSAIGYVASPSAGFGSLSPDDPLQFSTGTSDRYVSRLYIDPPNTLQFKLNIFPVNYSAVLCADGLPFAFDQNSYDASLGAHIWTNHGLSWTVGQQVPLSIWEVEPHASGYQNSDYAHLCGPDPSAVVWESELTVAQSTDGFAYLGASRVDNVYGTISNPTFTDAGRSYTVRWVATDSGFDNSVFFSVESNTDGRLAPFTLCLPGVEVDFPAGSGTRYEHNTGSPGGIAASWSIGDTVNVGIVRAPGVCDAITAPVIQFAESDFRTSEGVQTQVNVRILGGSDTEQRSISYRLPTNPRACDTGDNVLATPGEDFTLTPGTLTFTNNAQGFSVSQKPLVGLEILQDDIDEDDEEVFCLELHSPVKARLGRTLTLVRIVDDDAAKLSLSAPLDEIPPGRRAPFRITLETENPRPFDRNVNVMVSSSGLTGVPATNTVRITNARLDSSGKAAHHDFSIATGQLAGEGDGTITLTLQADTAATPLYRLHGTTSASVSVSRDAVDPSVVSLRPFIVDISEGDYAYFELRIHPRRDWDLPVTVDIGQQGDFLARGQAGERTVTIPAGKDFFRFKVRTVDDGVIEPAGAVTANLVIGKGYSFGWPQAGSVPVRDDDTPSVTLDDFSVDSNTEGGTIEVRLKLSQRRPVDVNVNLHIWENGDVLPASEEGVQTVTIKAGERTAVHKIPTDDDHVHEQYRTRVSATIGHGTDYTLGRRTHDSRDILDNDLPTITVFPVDEQITEGEPIQFRVQSDRQVNTPVRVSIGVGYDYGIHDYGWDPAISRFATIPAGATEMIFSIPTEDDDVVELEASVYGLLYELSGAYHIVGFEQNGRRAHIELLDNDGGDGDPTVLVPRRTATIDEGSFTSYSVVMSSCRDIKGKQITVRPRSGDPSLVTVSPASVTFTGANCHRSKNFRIRAANRGNLRGVTKVTISHSVTGALGASTVVVYVRPLTPPVVNAGDDIVSLPGETVRPQGTALMDPTIQPSPVTQFTWSQTSGQQVQLEESNTDRPRVIVPPETSPGQVLEFRFTATNIQGVQASDQMTVTVLAPPPTACAGPDQSGAPGESVKLAGRCSTNPFGKWHKMAHAWTQTAGTEVKLSSLTRGDPSFTIPDDASEGDLFEFELTVTAQDGQSDSDRVVVEVTSTPVASPPTACAGQDMEAEPGDSVTIEGTCSVNPHGIWWRLAHLWSQPAGQNMILSDPTRGRPMFVVPANAAVGTVYTFTLTVTDIDDESDSDEMTVTVVGPAPDESGNYAPVFDEGTSATRKLDERSPANTKVGDAVAASDANGDSLSYTLSGADASAFAIDGESGQITTIAGQGYVYAQKPVYRVSVTVDDGRGGTAKIDVVVNIQDQNDPPRFVEGDSATRSIAENPPPGTRVGDLFLATDPEVNPLTYSISGTDAGSFTMDQYTGYLKTKAGVVYDFETKPTYTLTVTATDPGGLSASIAVTVNLVDVVEGDPNPPTIHAVTGCVTELGNLTESTIYAGTGDDPDCRSHHQDNPARYFRFTIAERSTLVVNLSGASLFISTGTPKNGWGTVPGGGYAHRVSVRFANGKLVHGGLRNPTLTLAAGTYTIEAAGSGAFTIRIDPQ